MRIKVLLSESSTQTTSQDYLASYLRRHPGLRNHALYPNIDVLAKACDQAGCELEDIAIDMVDKRLLGFEITLSEAQGYKYIEVTENGDTFSGRSKLPKLFSDVVQGHKLRLPLLVKKLRSIKV